MRHFSLGWVFSGSLDPTIENRQKRDKQGLWIIAMAVCKLTALNYRAEYVPYITENKPITESQKKQNPRLSFDRYKQIGLNFIQI